MKDDIVLAFDVYGTLLSTESIAKKLAEHFGEDKANAISTKWRLYQLEYTWRINSMSKYEPFSTITQRSLRHALKEHGESLSQSEIDNLMKAYDSLSTFPDVPPALEQLAKEDGITCVAFSQGTYDMVSASMTQSPDLKPHASLFKELISSEKTRKFKPAPETYFHLAESTQRTKEQMGELWLVSGNPFDIVGARAVGMRAVWVDRAGSGWVDCLAEEGMGPDVVVKGLGEVAAQVKQFLGSSSK